VHDQIQDYYKAEAPAVAEPAQAPVDDAREIVGTLERE